MPKSYTLLIVEPSLAARIVIRSQFLSLEHHIDLAWDFESAMEYITVKLYDLILIDINLNQRNILIHQIKKNWRIGKEAPIMGLSSYEDYGFIFIRRLWVYLHTKIMGYQKRTRSKSSISPSLKKT